MFFHPLSDAQVLRAVIAPNTTWDAVTTSGAQEQLQNCVRAIVGVYAGACDLTRGTVDERVIDELPADEAWVRKSVNKVDMDLGRP